MALIADLPELAEGLVRSKVEIIVARTNFPIQAAMKATRTIPIVMLNGNFPVESGLIQTLARPGGNVTGTSEARSLPICRSESPPATSSSSISRPPERSA